MFWLGFGIYTIFMVLIFGFFIVAKIHTYKFRHYSVHIEPVTKALAIVLLILALVGYYLIFSGDTGNAPIQTVETANTQIY
ncbi:MAG: hypothetical protein PHN60_01820 [Candidatus Gracilibacteria bacterium]|nr:hypothetical protein [Candidatus Gracilibacteria bacterium]